MATGKEPLETGVHLHVRQQMGRATVWSVAGYLLLGFVLTGYGFWTVWRAEVRATGPLAVAAPALAEAAATLEAVPALGETASILAAVSALAEAASALAEEGAEQVPREHQVAYVWKPFGGWKPLGVGPVILDVELRLILIIFLVGSLGGAIASLNSLANYRGEGALTKSWFLHYLVSPWLGGGVALVTYFVLRAGLLPGGSRQLEQDPCQWQPKMSHLWQLKMSHST